MRMNKLNSLLVLLLLSAWSLEAQEKVDKRLNKELQNLVQGFGGTAGIYVQNLKTGRYAEVLADTIFPTASMIKVPIMCGIFDKIDKGELSYHQELIYRDSLFYAGEDIPGSFNQEPFKAFMELL